MRIRAKKEDPYMAKDSFQEGLSVLRTVAVVAVCSPSILMTATGSGKLKRSRLMRFEAPCTLCGSVDSSGGK